MFMSNKGHTLIECALALGILSVVLTGALGVFYRGALSDQSNQHEIMAMKACQEVMEQLAVMPINDLLAQNGVQFDFTAVTLETPRIGSIQVATISVSGTNKVYEIVVSIIHDGSEYAPFSAILTTRRSG